MREPNPQVPSEGGGAGGDGRVRVRGGGPGKGVALKSPRPPPAPPRPCTLRAWLWCGSWACMLPRGRAVLGKQMRG